MIIGYLPVNSDAAVKKTLIEYGKQNKLVIDKFVQEREHIALQWQKRSLYDLIVLANSGDTIVADKPLDLASSMIELLEVFSAAAGRRCMFAFIKDDLRLWNTNELVDRQLIFGLLKQIEQDFKEQRVREALLRRRAAGLPLGRPRGRKNKSLKLDKHRKDIVRYLELGISKASVAKLVGCHAQTLYNYIESQDIKQKATKHRKLRSKQGN